MSQHLSEWEAAAYVDGRLSNAVRARVETHLELCDACRIEVVEVVRAIDSPKPTSIARPKRRLLVSGFGLAAAAALAMVLLPQSSVVESRREQQRDVSGEATTEGVATIAVVRPVPGDSVAATDRQFVWRAVGIDATYQLIVGDAAGRILWRSTTGDTALTLPADIARAGQTYFWRVDALLPTGISATTRAQSFTVQRR